MKVLVLFFGVVSFVSGQSTDVAQCSWTNAPRPLNAYVHGCTNPPCTIYAGDAATVDVVFKAPRTMRTMTTRARASLIGIGSFPYNLGDDAVTCNHLTNTFCPVLENEIVMYQLRMELQDNWGGVTVIVEFSIEDENENSFICIRMSLNVIQTSQRAGNSTLTLN